MRLTTEQAKSIVHVEPYVIVRVVIDEEGYLDMDFTPIPVATNVLWDLDDLTKFVQDDQPEQYDQLHYCEATYLCHLKLEDEPYPNFGSFWTLIESELLATGPHPEQQCSYTD